MMENHNSIYHNHVFEKNSRKIANNTDKNPCTVLNPSEELYVLRSLCLWAWNEKTNSHTISKIWEVCDKADAD